MQLLGITFAGPLPRGRLPSCVASSDPSLHTAEEKHGLDIWLEATFKGTVASFSKGNPCILLYILNLTLGVKRASAPKV